MLQNSIQFDTVRLHENIVNENSCIKNTTFSQSMQKDFNHLIKYKHILR